MDTMKEKGLGRSFRSLSLFACKIYPDKDKTPVCYPSSTVIDTTVGLLSQLPTLSRVTELRRFLGRISHFLKTKHQKTHHQPRRDHVRAKGMYYMNFSLLFPTN